ncbi:unnamed protein product [Camellia sinensis]
MVDRSPFVAVQIYDFLSWYIDVLLAWYIHHFLSWYRVRWEFVPCQMVISHGIVNVTFVYGGLYFLYDSIFCMELLF